MIMTFFKVIFYGELWLLPNDFHNIKVDFV